MEFTVETPAELISALEQINEAGIDLTAQTFPNEERLDATVYLVPNTSFSFSEQYLAPSSQLALPQIRYNINLRLIGYNSVIERSTSASEEFCLISSNANLQIIGITFRNGREYGGAAIRQYNSNRLLELINCKFEDNRSLGGGGGAVDSSAHFIALNCEFRNNYSEDDGGAIELIGPGAYLEDCIFESNEAESSGGALDNNASTLVLKNCQFISNTAVYTGGAATLGGEEVRIIDCLFEDNQTTTTEYLETGGALGGALNTYISGSLLIQGCTFRNNQTDGWGGAFFSGSPQVVVLGTLFENNQAKTRGSAIYDLNTDLLICNYNIFEGNVNPSDADDPVIRVPEGTDFTYNYWDAADGPSGAGSGSGQAIQDNVLYIPFLGTSEIPEHEGSNTCFGEGNDTVVTGNPISIRTGEKREQATDLSLNTKYGSLAFTRSYRQSTQDQRDFMGRGWSHNHHISLSEDTGLKKIVVEQGEGTTVFYDDNADDTFEAAAGSSAVIVKDVNGYTLTQPDSSQYVFNTSGELLSHQMRNGQTWYYHYSSNQLVLVHDDANFNGTDESNIDWALRFAYYATSDFKDGKLWRVGIKESSNLSTTPTGPYVELDYAELSGVGVFLTRARDVLDYSQCYRYGFQEGETDTLLKTYLYRRLAILTAGITDCASTDVIELSDTSYTLNGSNEITQVVQSRGDGLISKQLDFATDSTSEEITGYPSYAMTHDFDNGVYQGTSDAEGQTQSQLLASNYKKAIETDRNGNKSFLRWSADGSQLEGVIDALGNEMQLRYDPEKRLIASIDAIGHTTLSDYEGDDREATATRVTNGQNLIDNGWMTEDSDWTSIGSVNRNQQAPQSGILSGRYVNADAANEGIESVAWDIVANNTYRLRAQVYVLSGTVKLQVPGYANLAVSSSGTGWQTLDVSDTPSTAGTGVQAELIADGAATEFYVEWVQITDDDGTNIVQIAVDGTSMSDAYWTDITGSEPLVHEAVSQQRYSGRFSRWVESSAANEGVESSSFDLVDGKTYQISAYVRPISGTVKLHLQGASASLASVASNGTGWQRLDLLHTATAGESASLRFLADGAVAEFFVDVVFALDDEILLRQTEKTYNSRRQVTSQKQIDPADGVSVLRETEYCYDDDSCYGGSAPERGLLWQTTIKEQGGSNDILITNLYDDFGRVVQVQQSSQFGDCEISYTVYDAKGQRVANICNYEPGVNNAPTTAAEAAALYDAVNYPDKNQVTTYTYDALGRRVAVTTDAGTDFARVTHFVHDSLGRVTRRIENYKDETAAMVAYSDPDLWSWDGTQWIDGTTPTAIPIEHGADLDQNLITDTEYNAFAQVRLQRDVLGHALLYGYNTIGQVVKQVINPLDDSYNNDYNGVDPDPDLSDYVVDNTVADADIVMNMRYDAVGNEIERSDALGRKVITVYDALNRPIKVIASPKDAASLDLNPGDVGYLASNDPRSAAYVLSQEPDRDQVLKTSYDSLGRVIRLQGLLENRDNGIEWDSTLYGYDTLGRQVRVIQHASDADYLEQNDDPSLADYEVEADATDVDFITETDYDVQGRVQLTRDLDDVFDNEIWQGYDGFNRVIQQVSNASSTGALDPDDPNYVGDLNDAALDLISKTDFNASGRVVKQRRVLRTNDAGTALEWVWTLYGYDSRGRVVKSIQNASNPSYNSSADEDLSAYVVSGNADEDRISETVYDSQGRMQKSIDTRGNTSLYGYDSANRRVTTIVNASDASYDYETNGDTQLASYTGSSPDADQDRISTTRYDLAGRVITTRDVAGRVMYTAYDQLGRSILRVSNYENPDNMGNPTYTDVATWSWDGTQWVDDASTAVAIDHGTAADTNLISEMVYNKGGELLSTRDVHGTVTAFTYDALGRRVQVTQAQGTNLETSDYTCFDKAGRMRRRIQNVIAQADLDARTNGAWVFDPQGHGAKKDRNIIHETVYDRASRAIQRINPVGDVVETAYLKSGQVEQVIHKDVMVEGSLQDVVMLYRYDAAYRRTLVVQNYVPQATSDPSDWVFESAVWKTGVGGTAIEHDPNSSGNASQNVIVQAAYDKGGRLLSLRDPNGNLTSYEYDQLGRRTKLNNPLGYEWLVSYEDVGQNSRVTMSNPGIEQISSVWQSYDVQQDFDRLGRLTELTYPDADVSPDLSFTYDVVGNRTAMLESDNSATVRETQYQYDAMDRLVQVDFDRDGDTNIEESVQYQYDERGLRTQLVIDPAGDNLQVTYLYDEKGRLVSLTDWDSQETRYDYDRVNRHTDTTLPNGVQSHYDYDAAGRLQHLRHREGYDTLAAFKYEVDARGNRVKTWETVAGETSTILHDDDAVTEKGTWAISGNFYETNQWDAKLTLTVWGSQDVQLTIGTGPDHSIFDIYIDGTLYISPDAYSATPSERTIDLLIRDKQLKETVIELRNRHAKNLASNGYKLQFKQLTLGKVHEIAYDYDALARLLSADYADNSRNYAYLYDLAGNRLQESVSIGITTTITDWTYDAANRVNTMKVGSNPLDTFDYDADGNLLAAGGQSYMWNHAGRMTQLDTGSVNYHYEYDGDNNRVEQRLGSVVTKYLLDIQPGLAEVLRETDGTDTRHYIHGMRGVQATEADNTWLVLLQDGLGSVRAQVDSSAQVDASQHHSPYGQAFGLTGTWEGSFGYAGEQIDPTGLSYNRARYYDPNMGMFNALDPFEGMMSDPMSMNGYSYVHGNPINGTDPSGEVGVFGGLVGAGVGGALGLVTGFIFGDAQARVTYDLTMAGHCGCERKLALQSMNREDFIRGTRNFAAGMGGAIGLALGAVTGATAGAAVGSTGYIIGAAVSVFGMALELHGLHQTVVAGQRMVWDFLEDRKIDDRCNVADFLFGVLDIVSGKLLDYGGQRIMDTYGPTGDGSPRNPDVVEDVRSGQQRPERSYRSTRGRQILSSWANNGGGSFRLSLNKSKGISLRTIAETTDYAGVEWAVVQNTNTGEISYITSDSQIGVGGTNADEIYIAHSHTSADLTPSNQSHLPGSDIPAKTSSGYNHLEIIVNTNGDHVFWNMNGIITMPTGEVPITPDGRIIGYSNEYLQQLRRE